MYGMYVLYCALIVVLFKHNFLFQNEKNSYNLQKLQKKTCKSKSNIDSHFKNTLNHGMLKQVNEGQLKQRILEL